MKKVRLITQNALLFFLFLFFAFSLLEIVTRLQDKLTRHNVYDIQRVPVPYIGFTGVPNEGDHNKEGYRGKLLKDSKAIDIVILGGSTVYNGTPALPELLEQNLLKGIPHKKINVYNLGIPSTKSSGELSKLVHQVLQHRPEIVIAYHGSNDIGLFGGDPRVGYPFDFYLIEKNPLSVNGRSAISTLEVLMTRSYFIRYYFSGFIHKEIFGLRKLKKGEYSYSKKRANRASNLFFQNIEKMNLISKAHGIKFHSIIQPIKKQISKNDNGLWHGIEELRAKYQKEKNKHVTSFIDYFEDKQSCFVDDVHIKQDCKNLLAQDLTAVISKLL